MRRTILVAVAMLASSAAAAQTTQAGRSGASAGADSLYARKDFAGAAKAYDAIVRTSPKDGRSWMRLGASLYSINDFTRAADAYTHAAELGVAPVISSYNAAASHARAGSKEHAFEWLDRAVKAGYSGDAAMKADPDFASVRDDTRFQQLVAQAARAARPCESDPESHRFDFWVGEWDVMSAVGGKAGQSSVQKILENCVVFENWTNAQGGSGKSLNAYNRALKQWQQFWTDQYGGVTEYRESEWKGPSLVLTARATPRDTSAWLRMTFTPVDANTVRQFGETSKDQGASWTTSFDLYYHRKK
jgi:tetratricopeptide (TPR) repeat protein